MLGPRAFSRPCSARGHGGQRGMAGSAQEKMRNIAVIAHVDHGKTTLVDKLIEACGEVAGCVGLAYAPRSVWASAMRAALPGCLHYEFACSILPGPLIAKGWCVARSERVMDSLDLEQVRAGPAERPEL